MTIPTYLTKSPQPKHIRNKRVYNRNLSYNVKWDVCICGCVCGEEILCIGSKQVNYI